MTLPLIRCKHIGETTVVEAFDKVYSNKNVVCNGCRICLLEEIDSNEYKMATGHQKNVLCDMGMERIRIFKADNFNCWDRCYGI